MIKDPKLFALSLLIAVILWFIAQSAKADELHRNRVHVHVYPGVQFIKPPSEDLSSPCFPTGCGRILGPYRNDDPNARSPEYLTACIYDVTGTLVYEREGKYCSYKWTDANARRVERRRQEWLRNQR